MSGKQKAAVIAACILYAATIFGFFYLDLLPIIICFALFTIAIVTFAYLCFQTHNDYTGAEHLQQEIGILKAEKDALSMEMNGRLAEKDQAFENLRQEAENLREKLSAAEKEKEGAEEKLKEVTERASDADRLFESLLPPDDDDASEVDIIDIAKSAIRELEGPAKEAGLRVTISSASEKLTVRASAKRLLIMFRNIIDNSIKYMQKAGTLVVTISAIEDDIFIVLKDTGKGLPEDETKHIFELNFQGSNRISGNGLGLTQAKAIVEHYGGTIYARSPGGNGMGIYIQLPTT